MLASLAAALTAALWLLLLEFPVQAAVEQLDPSWRAILAHDLLHGARQGSDTIFTYGPLGYLLAPAAPYVGPLYWPKVVCELVVRALVSATLIGLVWRQPAWGARAAGILVIAALVPAMSLFLDMVVVAALALHVLVGLPRPARWLALVTMTVFAMSKVTLLAQTAASVLAIAVAHGRRGGWPRAVEPIAVAASTALALWFGQGQSLADLPAWLRGSLEIASGYEAAMALRGPAFQPWLAGLAWLGYLSLNLVAWRRGAPLSGLASVLVMFLVCWKSGVVRQDGGHFGVFCGTLALTPFLLGMLPAGDGPRLVPRAAAFLLVGCGFLGLHLAAGDTSPYRTLRLAEHVAWRWRYNWRFLTQVRLGPQAHDQIRSVLAQVHPLTMTKERIGQATIDNLTLQQGILFLHDLTVHHRPVFQSYAAYTPWLQAANGEFFAGEGAPRFVLLKLDAIDHRLPLMPDSQSYRQLLARYRPVGEERGFVLLELGPIAVAMAEEAAIERSTRCGDWVDLPARPGCLTLLAVDAEPSLAGKLRALLYQPADLLLETKTASGRVDQWRVTTAMMRLPFVVSPRCTDTKGFAALWTDQPGEDVVACRIVAAAGAEWCFQRDCGVRVTYQKRPSD